MSNWVEGKVAVVTGAGNGIGRACALLLAAEGANVVVNDPGVSTDGTGFSKGPADEVTSMINDAGGRAVATYSSVADREAVERMIQTAVDRFGKIDILINNAGIVRDRMIWRMEDEEWDDVIKVHLYGHFYSTRAAVRAMREGLAEGRQKNGRIINFSSNAGIYGNAGQPNYAAAKLGIVAFTWAVASSCARFGITCNAIAPTVRTRMGETVPKERLLGLAQAVHIKVDPNNPEAVLGGPPSSIAPAIVWLASDESQFVTGRVFKLAEGQIGVYEKMKERKTAYKRGTFEIDEVSQLMQELIQTDPEAS